MTSNRQGIHQVAETHKLSKAHALVRMMVSVLFYCLTGECLLSVGLPDGEDLFDFLLLVGGGGDDEEPVK